MPKPVTVELTFQDDDGRRTVENYQLATQLADDSSNMAAVMTQADLLAQNVDGISYCGLRFYTVKVVEDAPSAINDASDVAVYAFVRLLDSVTFEEAYERIPSPNMGNYDAAANGLLDPAFQTDWMADVNPLIVNPKTGNAYNFKYAQKKTRKRVPNLG